MEFATGKVKTGGRQKGVSNKITHDVREMLLSALDAVGGQHYFIQQAHQNPKAFLALVSKIIPQESKTEVNIGLAERVKAAKEILNSERND